MARALGSLFFAGATIGAVSLVLPHPADASELGLWSNVALAYVGSLAIFAVGPRLPVWGFHVALVAGSVLITRAVLLSGESVSFYSVWFIWVGLYSFYFFGRTPAAAHVTFASVLYAATLLVHPVDSSLARWLTTIATLLVAGVFIDTLVHRARRQAEVSARSASSLARFAAAAHDLAGLSDPDAARHALCEAAASVTGASAAALWEPSAVDLAMLEVSARAGAVLPAAADPEPAERALATAAPVTAPLGLWQPVIRETSGGAVLALHWESARALDDDSIASLGALLAAEALITLNRLELLGRLAEMARTDELTGLPNRRAWEEHTPRELARARRDQTPLCIALLDLDHFKAYNDNKGHQAGDRLLKQAAAAWRRELRTTDLLARYGGEEFALMLPGCDAEQAIATVERIRQATPQGQACSAGVACWDGLESAFELFGRADAALYEAKRGGRDRAIWSGAA
jgi:diguanylate cyclase (GGDEF)-like protein